MAFSLGFNAALRRRASYIDVFGSQESLCSLKFPEFNVVMVFSALVMRICYGGHLIHRQVIELIDH